MKRKKPKAEKWKPELDHAYVTWAAIDRGLLVYVLYVPNHMSPIGFVWGRICGAGSQSTFDVCGSFVPAWARRFGVRTRINKTIFEHVSTITTSGGSKDGGLAFLKSRGYKRDRNVHCWFLKKTRRSALK